MSKLIASTVLAASCAVAAALSSSAQPVGQAVSVADKPADRRVDILIDGKPFTSYIYPASLEKPVLYPIRSPRGTLVTRGYPLEPKPGERADHTHHVGHWFNYGDVNGYDFWGHSSATPPKNKPKMGRIVHKQIVSASGGAARGELVARSDWVIPDGSTLLHEETRFVFSGATGRRAIERVTTWTAAAKPVTFNDTKEGAFGIRVARTLEHPATAAEVLVAANGKDTEKRLDTNGVVGRYIGSDGKTGEDVWGTRGPWMGLTGMVDGAPVTLAIFDHPSNHGHPTYWHARGYGLFAANPFGRHGYDPKQPPATTTIEPGKSLTFRHLILIRDGQLAAGDLAQEYAGFAKVAGSR